MIFPSKIPLYSDIFPLKVPRYTPCLDLIHTNQYKWMITGVITPIKKQLAQVSGTISTVRGVPVATSLGS